MNVPSIALRRLARSAGALAVLSGAYGFLYLMGAFGPVSCWNSRSSSGGGGRFTGSGDVTTEVRHGCEAGVDYLFGRTAGNAPVLFFWAVALLLLVVLGGLAVRFERRSLTWACAIVGGVIVVVGVFSIGWFFLLPTLALLTAATALSVESRRGRDESGPAER